jgi:hypothetical protein
MRVAGRLEQCWNFFATYGRFCLELNHMEVRMVHSAITSWLCGGCGQSHGWDCPYYGYPGKPMTEQQRVAAKEKMDADQKAGNWPFKKIKTAA